MVFLSSSFVMKKLFLFISLFFGGLHLFRAQFVFQPDSVILLYAPKSSPTHIIRRVFAFGKTDADEYLQLDFIQENNRFTYQISAFEPIILKDAKINGKFTPPTPPFLFSNGFQSWSHSRFLTPNEKQKPIKKIMLPYAQHYGDYHFFDYQKFPEDQHSWTYTYTFVNENIIELLASINDDPGYTLIQWNYSTGRFAVSRDCSGKIIHHEKWLLFDLLHLKDVEYKAWNTWSTMYKNNEPVFLPQKARGWTSWYYYYTNIDEKIILHNLQNFSNQPDAIFQIDDGFQMSVGEWTQANKKFPHGMKYITDSIHATGKKAGLWLAPFVCEKNSMIFQKHPDWIVKDAKGNPVKAGYNPGWSGWYYPLDIYHPEVREYLSATFDTILNHWNFDLIKADFLFAAGIMPRPDLNKTRGEVMADAMDWLRELTKGKLLLGCGVPLAPAFKRVDYCRIGNDIHTGWEFKILKSVRASERPSTWSSLTNTITRSSLGNRMFMNDPDVFILRTKKQSLRDDEKALNILINHLFGQLLFTSDDLSEYDTETRKIYEHFIELNFYQTTLKPLAVDVYSIQTFLNKKPLKFIVNLSDKRFDFKSDTQLAYIPRRSVILINPDGNLQHLRLNKLTSLN